MLYSNFFNFFSNINIFTGSLRKEHNSFLSYLTLFGFKKYSIINYKMIKLQFRIILLLLHNLLLREFSFTLTNYDKEFSNLLYIRNLRDMNIAEEWINPVVSNRPGTVFTKDFIIQQVYSAFINSFIILNIGNIRFFDLNNFIMRRRALLVSSLNTDAKILDNQYYLVANTKSYIVLFFLINFFGHLFKKVIKTDDTLSYNNILRYRYWFGMRHMFSMRYIRRSLLLRGLLARGLLEICLQKLTKSYRRIILYNLYCTEFSLKLQHNFEINSISTFFLKKMHDSRLLDPFIQMKKKRKNKSRVLQHRQPAASLRRS